MKGWLDKERDDVKRRWNAGESATTIAADYGVSRNSIIGMVHRMGGVRKAQPRPPKPKRSTAPGPVRPKAQPKPQPIAMPAAPTLPAKEIERVALIDLKEVNCRFPVGSHDGAAETRLFCGVKVEKEGSPYCNACQKLCYVPAEPRRVRNTSAARLGVAA